MARWIIGGTLAAWAGIITLAWWLADRRVDICGDYYDDVYRACTIRTLAVRDNVLITGLAVALIALVAVALVKWRRAETVRPPSSSREMKPPAS